jgi:hypothetical protein
MVTIENIQDLEKLIGQLKALHTEIGQLARKSPNDAVNNFKINLVNKVIERANNVLGDDFIPDTDFVGFDQDDIPSNSDVTMVISQYLEEAERFRSYHVVYHAGRFVYKLNDEPSQVRAAPPSWSKK